MPHSRLPKVLVFVAALAALAACAGRPDSAEEHRRLSLRLEHDPPGSVPADHEVEIRARVRSSLEPHRVDAWLRVDEAGSVRKIPLHLDSTGEASGTIPAHPRGAVLRYALEARDAAGLVVSLPRHADQGQAYELRFEGRSSAFLGGIAGLATIAGVLLYLGAGAAAVQCLRGRMSVGPAGLLGGVGVLVIAAGLFLVGGVHAFQVTGSFWPSTPLLLALSRGDLALVTLAWAGLLYFGRETLLDEAGAQTARRDRAIAGAGIAAAVLLTLLAIW